MSASALGETAPKRRAYVDSLDGQDDGAVSVDRVADEIHVAVRDPDGEVVSVSRPNEVFAHEF